MSSVADLASPERAALPRSVQTGRVIAIARGLTTPAAVQATGALVEAGIHAVEVTMDSPDALGTIATLVEAFGPRIELGAGTVLSIPEAADALAAGATYVISPHTDPDLVTWLAERGVPALPGALTPTEVLLAWRAGAAGVKVFPAGPAGPGHVRALGGPIADVPLIPTGGIDAGNAAAFLQAGAVAVGVGGWLMGDGDPDLVAERARELLAVVNDSRS